MTDEQVMFQLQRLETIARLDNEKMPEYCRSLRGCQYNSLSKAIDFLIDTYTGHTFPRPGEIHTAIKQVTSQEKTWQPEHDGSYRDGEITAAWTRCFRLCWLITDRDRRVYEFEHLVENEVWEDRPENKPAILARYVKKQEGLETYLRGLGVDVEELDWEPRKRVKTEPKQLAEEFPF